MWLVEQSNNTKINLCLIVCNGNGTKLGSNFINTRPKQKVLEIQITNLWLDKGFHQKLKKFLEPRPKVPIKVNN